MRRFTWAQVALIIFMALPVPVLAKTGLSLEYIAHAAFRLESSKGTQVIIDPYADRVWLSYDFPKNLEADAVFITHGHYDHDGGFSQGKGFPFKTPIPTYLAPGVVKLRDITATGLDSLHHGKRPNGQVDKNVIWVFETSGIRIAHLGDNRRLSADDIKAIGRVDVLLIGRNGSEAVSPEAQTELALIREQMHPKVIIPMHYRLPDLEISDTSAKGLETADAWLAQQPNVKRVATNIINLTPATLPRTEEIWVLPHSPLVTRPVS